MSDAIETTQEVVAEVAEEVSEKAQAVADVVRGLTKMKAQYALLGAAVGAAASAAATYYITVRRLDDKYRSIAEEQIAEMKEHYQDKLMVLEEKPKLEDLVVDKGYVSTDISPPLAVAPPAALVEAAAEEDEVAVDDDGDPLEAEMVDVPKPEMRNVFDDRDPEAPVSGGWDTHAERRRRSPSRPYVIHMDEKDEFEHYQDSTLTYYEADDVLANERDEIMDAAERERVIGEKNLERFGEGTDDPSTVFVRNDVLEMQFEIIKSSGSYTEEVQGFEHSDYEYPRRHKMRFDDDPPTR
jgi:hypothetical protein